MRIRVTIVVLAALSAFATGCSQSEETPTPSPSSGSPSVGAKTTSPTASPSASPSASTSPSVASTLTPAQTSYLAEARTLFPEYREESDEDLIAAGELVCAAIASGGDSAEQQIKAAVVKEGYTQQQADAAVALAKKHLC